MSQKVLMTTGEGENQVRYTIFGSEEMPNLSNLSFRMVATGKYNLPIGSCVVSVDIGLHNSKKPTTYTIKNCEFTKNSFCDYEDFVCNLFHCIEKFIDQRELSHCKICGYFTHKKGVVDRLTNEGYELNENLIEKSIYVPYARTPEQNARIYIIDNEDESSL